MLTQLDDNDHQMVEIHQEYINNFIQLMLQ
jgi:hypothetical protein